MSHGAKERVQGKGTSREQRRRRQGDKGDRKRGTGSVPMQPVSGISPGEFQESEQGAGADRSIARAPPPIHAGRAYQLRNGTIVHVVNKREIPSTLNGKPSRYSFWVGYIDGSRQRLTWGEDGKYSPVADGPLDILARA